MSPLNHQITYILLKRNAPGSRIAKTMRVLNKKSYRASSASLSQLQSTRTNTHRHKTGCSITLIESKVFLNIFVDIVTIRFDVTLIVLLPRGHANAILSFKIFKIPADVDRRPQQSRCVPTRWAVFFAYHFSETHPDRRLSPAKRGIKPV